MANQALVTSLKQELDAGEAEAIANCVGWVEVTKPNILRQSDNLSAVSLEKLRDLLPQQQSPTFTTSSAEEQE